MTFPKPNGLSDMLHVHRLASRVLQTSLVQSQLTKPVKPALFNKFRLQFYSSSTPLFDMFVCNSIPIAQGTRVGNSEIVLEGSAELLSALSAAEERNAKVFPIANILQQKSKLLMHHAQNDFTPPEEDSLKQELDNLFDALEVDNRARSRDGVMYSVSNFITYQCFVHFMKSGCLLRRSELDTRFTDTEFLMGVMGFCKNLERYALRQATLKNRVSVECCKELATDLETELLKFNFRNGTLRRTYDGIKYAVRKFEDLLYDLEMNCTFSSKVDEENVASSSKEADVEVVYRVHQPDFEQVNSRISAFDLERENVIVQSRKIQSNGKSAVYSCHRSNLDEAHKSLEEGAKMIQSLTQQYQEELPEMLSQGSFNSAVEEWAEGALFYLWLTNKQTVIGSRELLKKQFDVQVGESCYLGAVVDFTGEVGRWAVAQATSRNSEGVDMAAQSIALVQDLFLQLGDHGVRDNNLRKKTESLTTNLIKLEKIQYDLAMKPVSSRKRQRTE